MKMKSLFVLMVNLAISSSASTPPVQISVVDLDELETIDKDLLIDDIREPSSFLRSSILPGNEQWTSPVAYVLDSSLTLNARGVIMRAFEQYRLKTCIDFKPRDSEDYYIDVKKESGCWSYIGRVFANGQDLSIGSGCDSVATVEHEFLHALGFYHEQSRYDRDNYVRIVTENIQAGKENNFEKVSSNESTTQGVPYDYMSVMHYGKDYFTNGNGNTIVTIDPKYQDVIGQRLDMSPNDALELNLLYKCNSTSAFMFYCGFSNGAMCQMVQCSQTTQFWEMVQQVSTGPSSDHTSLPSGSGDQGEETGYFMHANTASGQVGDSARLETQTMTPKRDCNVQCLQFYYFHSGNNADELNIWIREFENEQDSTGTLRHMEQISDSSTSHWKHHHVSLNATKSFQVVFEVRKGAGNSTGGFSIDDINLSETECPHVTIQIDDIEQRLNTSTPEYVLSPKQYSKEGYAFRVAVRLNNPSIGMFVQLMSGDNDDQLQWPALQKQMTFQLLDQTPNIQQQMSKQRAFTTESGTSYWDKPSAGGAGPLLGYPSFTTSDELQTREFIKGGSAVFMFNFEDLTPLINGSTLPCAQLRAVDVPNPRSLQDEGPCTTETTTTKTTPVRTTTEAPTKAKTTAATTNPPTTTKKTAATTTNPPTTAKTTTATTNPPTTAKTTAATTNPPTTAKTTAATTNPPTTAKTTAATTTNPPTTTKTTAATTTDPPTTAKTTAATTTNPPTTTKATAATTTDPPTTAKTTAATTTDPPTTAKTTAATTTNPPTTTKTTAATTNPPNTTKATAATTTDPPTTTKTTTDAPTTTNDVTTTKATKTTWTTTTTPSPTHKTSISTTTTATTATPPVVTTDNSIFSLSPGLAASPFIVLFGLLLLLQ